MGSLEVSSGSFPSVVLCRSEDEIIDLIQVYRSPLVAVSCASPEKDQIKNFLQKVHTVNQRALMCIGGPHVSAKPGDMGSLTHWLVRGESERLFPRIIRSYQEDKLPVSCQILSGGKAVDLNFFPPFPSTLNIFGPIELSRGCPHHCLFCQTGKLFGHKVRERDPDTVLHIVEKASRGKRLDLRFITSDALSYPQKGGIDRLDDFLYRLRKIAGPEGRIFFGSFPSEVRPESVTARAVAMLKKRVDNTTLVIGIDMGGANPCTHIFTLTGKCFSKYRDSPGFSLLATLFGNPCSQGAPFWSMANPRNHGRELGIERQQVKPSFLRSSPATSWQHQIC